MAGKEKGFPFAEDLGGRHLEVSDLRFVVCGLGEGDEEDLTEDDVFDLCARSLRLRGRHCSEMGETAETATMKGSCSQILLSSEVKRYSFPLNLFKFYYFIMIKKFKRNNSL